jgi:hypothetical protein
MVTPELISYVTAELNKGKTKEQIRTVLLSGGGWSEQDVLEVFQSVPQGEKLLKPTPKFIEPSTNINSFRTSDLSGIAGPQKKRSFLKVKEFMMFVLVFGAIFVAWYFFRPQIAGVWHSLTRGISSFAGGYLNKPEEPVVQNQAPEQPASPVVKVVETKDCGITTAPDRKKPETYQKDEVLQCLGAALLNCDPAEAVLKDPLFPNKYKITNKEGVCTFQLSYADDSTLTDISGNKLAGQYVSCPVSSVKKMEEDGKTVTFAAPNEDLASEYAAEIYFYGNLGLFIENNFDKTKIGNLGCGGSFIDSMIASYNKSTASKKK